MVRGSWRLNRTAIYWPPLLWPSALCLSRSPGLLSQRPRGPALCWMMAFFTASYQQLFWTLTQLGAPSPLGLVWLSLPHIISNSVRSLTVWFLVLTELYISSTPTQLPIQSLEWHVWLSSSGNNSHAVQRSLSSGVSVYECIMGLSHFISQICPRDLFWLLAIGMYHFLLVYHLGMACLPWPKVKIQQITHYKMVFYINIPYYRTFNNLEQWWCLDISTLYR